MDRRKLDSYNDDVVKDYYLCPSNALQCVSYLVCFISNCYRYGYDK